MSTSHDSNGHEPGGFDPDRLDRLATRRAGEPVETAPPSSAKSSAPSVVPTDRVESTRTRPVDAPVATAVSDDLVLDEISLVIGEKQILQPMTLRFPRGRVTALSGPSGSGKTTALSIAGGLLRPTRGAARLGELAMWQGDGDPRHEVAFVLQVYGLVPILSARENVAIALRARGMRPVEADERADLELARFHIGDLGDRQVEELSGGQMQRVACARCFAVEPTVLLADEPTSELDEGNREHVMAQLAAEAARGAVVVVATHDPAVVDAADHHFVLDEGVLTDHVAAVGELHPGFHG